MSAEAVLLRVSPEDLNAFVAEQCLPRLRDELLTAGPQRRLRVADLPPPVMDLLARELDAEGSGPPVRWAARILAPDADAPWRATATKLIELRNALVPPLLVFLPSGVRTAAEDSLDIATFTEIPIAPRTPDFARELVKQLPSELRVRVEDALEYLRKEKLVRSGDAEVDYLLTLRKNGSTAAAAGGALHVFGLLPDFVTFEAPDLRQRLSRNQSTSRLLAEVRRPLQERIARLRIQPNTLQRDLFVFLRDRHAEEPTTWAAEIACDPKWRHLALENWPFLDSLEDASLRLILDALDLPMQTADEVGGATPLRVWDLTKEKELRVSCASAPAPALATSWKSFRIQLLQLLEGQPTPVWSSNNFPKPKSKSNVRKFSRKLKGSDLDALPEGSYYVRIDALSEDGVVLTERDAAGAVTRTENESDFFYLARGKVETEPEPSRAVRAGSFADAWCAVAAKATDEAHDGQPLPAQADLTGAWDLPAKASVRGDVAFTFENAGANGLTIVLPGLLRRLEYEALESPAQLGLFRLDFAGTSSLSDVEIKRRPTGPLPTDAAALAYVSARKKVFEAILGQHAERSKDKSEAHRRLGTVETTDLLARGLRPLVEAHLEAFIEWVRSTMASSAPAQTLRLLAGLDVTEVRWRASGGDPGRALLLGPLHPLRMLWHLQHAALTNRVLDAWQRKTETVPSWKAFLEQIRHGLVPTNVPMVAFDDAGRGFVEREHLTAHWSLYLPDRAPGDGRLDLGTCRANARRQLGVRGRYVEPSGLSARELALRVLEYLDQHPYVEQLRINVFNPGDGQLVADLLRDVEAARLALEGWHDQPPSLRYAVQMFAGAEHIDETGEALDALLDPERQVAETDEFTLASGNHLLPKLLVARSTLDEFLLDPNAFTAHLTVFAEHFRAEARLGDVRHLRRGTFVAGLVAEPETRRVERAEVVAYGWTKGIRPQAPADAEPVERLLVSGLEAVQVAQAAAASGGPPPEGTAPTLALRLEPADQALIRQVHDTSDWVLTIDRNLGLDYFDGATTGLETGYLLDFSPEFLQEDQPRVMLTTRSAVELASLVRPTLDHFGLKLPEGDEIVVLETLRSLSGRFALRMLSGRSQAAEVVGLLVARWALERAGLLRRRVVIPVDAHRSWFAAAEKDPLSVVKQRRADLLLLRLRPRERLIDIAVVEVKYREELPSGKRGQFYADMRSQADNTVDRLRELFDPDLYSTPRADRLLRAKELANVLSFYVGRAQRYGLVEPSAVDEAWEFIDSLDAGYQLCFSVTGVLYEQRATGYHVDEDEPGFPVHRVGGDVAQRLLGEALSAFRTSRGVEPEERQSRPPAVAPLTSMAREFRLLRTQLGEEDDVLPPPAVAGATPADAPGELEHPPTAERSPRAPKPADPGDADSPRAETRDTGAGVGARIGENEALAPVADAPSDPPAPPVAPEPAPSLGSVVVVGAHEQTQQLGVLGRMGNAKVAVDLNGCNTISLFGVQGFGKSYTMGVIAEMAAQSLPGINILPAPLATVIFHYHKSDAYEPEFASAVHPNTKAREVERLLAEYGAHPAGLADMLLLVPAAKEAQRRAEYPGIEVRPIKFASSELGADGWKFLMGAVGNDALYVKQIVSIMQRCRGHLTLERLKAEVADADLAKGLRKLADARIALAEDYIDDTARLGDVLRPGRTVIVDLRDEWLEQDDALGLFVVMMTIFGATKYQGQTFSKLMVFDEAHKYITESELIGQVVAIIREMRHQATSVLIASQDPLSVPRAVIELTSLLILHRMTSPQWLKHLKGAIAALENVTEAQVGALMAGEALVWAQRSTDLRFTQRPQKVTIRPRATQHGGGTKTAVAGATLR